MKNLIISIFAALIGICCLGIVCVISGKDARQMELNSNVGNAVEGTVSHCMEDLGTETDQRIFLADAVTAAVCELHTDSEVSVRIWGADEKRDCLEWRWKKCFVIRMGEREKRRAAGS